jgi:MFS family permease
MPPPSPPPAPASGAPEPLFTLRFVLLWCYAFVTFFSAFQLLPTFPLRILELGGTQAQAGWFLSVYTFASAFAAPLMGSIADRVGRRRMLIVASIAFIAFSLLYGFVTHLPLLLVVGAIHGSIWSGILSSASAIMSEYIPESRRTQGFAYWGLASNSAIAIAPAVGMWVFHYGWQTLCIEMAALSVLMTGGALLQQTHVPRAHGKAKLSDAWDWHVVVVTTTLTMLALGYGGITSYAAIFARQKDISPVSLFFTVFAVTNTLVRVLTSHLGDRFGYRVVLYPSLLLVPVSFVVLAFTTHRWEMILSAVIFGIGFGSAYPAFVTFILANTDPARRARTFGSIIWAFDTGIGAGSLTVGTIGAHYGLRYGFLAAAAFSILALPLFLLTSGLIVRRGTSLAAALEHATASE